jgi:hypothetical protein
MKKTLLFIVIIMFLIIILFQITYRSDMPVSKYCLKIDSLQQSYQPGIYSMNGLIPELESVSGIEASCNKGTLGCLYDEASFDTDIKRWKKYFKCN